MKNLYNIIFMLIAGLYAKAQTVSGKVIDNLTQKPISFVEVTISPTNKSIHTDDNGVFKFEEVPNGNYTLHFLSSEYTYKKVEIKVDKAKTVVDVALQLSKVSLDEVVIFATPTQPTKRVADVLYTGVEINQKGLEIIGSTGLTNVHNALNISPSVSVLSQDPYGLSGNEMRIRGVRSFFSGMTTEGIPNYGIMPIGAREDIYDAENLETISLHKGAVPSDVFSASGNRGGSIDIRYKRPTNDFGFNINQSYGSNNFTRTFLRLDTGEFNTGTSAFVSYSYTEADKWKGAGKLAKRDHITTAISQKLGKKFNLELMYNYNDVFKHNFRGFSMDLIKDYKKNYNFDFTTKLTGNPAKDRFYYDYNKGNFKNQLGIAMLHYQHNDNNRGSVKFYITKEDAACRATQKPRKIGTETLFIIRDSHRDLKQVGVTADWSGKIKNIDYALGYWFEAFSSDISRVDKNAKDMSLLKKAPQFKSVSLGDTYIHNPFIKLSYSHNNFRVQAGLRYMANVSSARNVYKLIAKNPLKYNTTPEKDMSTGTIVHSALLPSFGLGYKFSKQVETYLNYGRNYMRPYAYMPTFNAYTRYRQEFLANNFTYEDIIGGYDMETSDNFDLGVIFNHKKVKINANVYYSKQKDVLVNVVSPLPNVKASYNQNVGKLTAYGAELETYINLNRNFTVFVHPSYTKMAYDNNIERMMNGKKTVVELKGNQSPATPEFMLKTGVLYNYKGFRFNSILNYTGERYGDALNKFKVPDFTVVDASLSYNHNFGKTIKSISVGMEFKNVLDRKYIGVISVWDDAQEGRASYSVGFPRTYLGSLKINF